ncbi:MAG: FmdB family transcriptional regulator [Chloroflexi bacterium]|nr:FmdB family transcriptional regulator [Chloroflexota bacterium]
MPIYEYECTHCRTRFERRQSWTDDPVQTCPECTGKVRRVYHPVGIVFKGSGFYSTDNRKNGSSSIVGDSAESKPADSTTAKPESAPAASGDSAGSKAESRSDTKVATA